MKGSHFHIGVRDLNSTLKYFREIWQLNPTLSLPHMACLPFGGCTLVLDRGDHDIPATLAFHTENCDETFRELTGRGAEVISAPTTQPWGVRGAYFKGPGALTLELEQAVTVNPSQSPLLEVR